MTDRILRTSRSAEPTEFDASQVVTFQIGEAVREAIEFARKRGPGQSIQISVEDPDAGLVFVTVRPWARRAVQ